MLQQKIFSSRLIYFSESVHLVHSSKQIMLSPNLRFPMYIYLVVIMTCKNWYSNAKMLFMFLRWYRNLNACLYVLCGWLAQYCDYGKVLQWVCMAVWNLKGPSFVVYWTKYMCSFQIIKADGFLCTWRRAHTVGAGHTTIASLWRGC